MNENRTELGLDPLEESSQRNFEAGVSTLASHIQSV
jgi:hypothetical protein